MTERRMETKLISIGVADTIHRRMISDAPEGRIRYSDFMWKGPHHKIIQAHMYDCYNGSTLTVTPVEGQETLNALTFIGGTFASDEDPLRTAFDETEAFAAIV